MWRIPTATSSALAAVRRQANKGDGHDRLDEYSWTRGILRRRVKVADERIWTYGRRRLATRAGMVPARRGPRNACGRRSGDRFPRFLQPVGAFDPRTGPLVSHADIHIRHLARRPRSPGDRTGFDGSDGTSGCRGYSAGLMGVRGHHVLNGVGHLGGSLFFQRWLPGTTSAPLLVGTSIWLALRTRDRGQLASSRWKHAV